MTNCQQGDYKCATKTRTLLWRGSFTYCDVIMPWEMLHSIERLNKHWIQYWHTPMVFTPLLSFVAVWSTHHFYKQTCIYKTNNPLQRGSKIDSWWNMKFFLVLSLVGLALSAPFAQEKDWQQWKRRHGKKYVNEVEESIRRAVWFRTFKHIEEHNKDDAYSYSLGLNKFSDMVSQI